MKQPKYITSEICGIITQIALRTEIAGYTEGVIESMLPDTEKWKEGKIQLWIKENNRRMRAICKFLNKNNL